MTQKLDTAGLFVISLVLLVFGIPGIGSSWCGVLGVFVFAYAALNAEDVRRLRYVGGTVFALLGIVLAYPFLSIPLIFLYAATSFLFGSLIVQWILNARSSVPLLGFMTGSLWMILDAIRGSLFPAVPTDLLVLGWGDLTGIGQAGLAMTTALSVAIAVIIARLCTRKEMGRHRPVSTVGLAVVMILVFTHIVLLAYPFAKARDTRPLSLRVAVIGHAYRTPSDPVLVSHEFFEGIRSAARQNTSLVIIPDGVTERMTAEERISFHAQLEALSSSTPEMAIVYADAHQPTAIGAGGQMDTKNEHGMLRLQIRGQEFTAVSGSQRRALGAEGMSIILSDETHIRSGYGNTILWERFLADYGAISQAVFRASYGGTSAIIDARGGLRGSTEGTGIVFTDL